MNRRLDRERQRVTTSILKELKKQDSLKKDILAELNRSPSRTQLLQHPAFLLFLTFIFTSVLGATFSSYWQSREWYRQQALQARQRALEHKYQIADDVSQAIGESHAAAAGVIAALQIDDDRSRARELKEKVEAWQQAKQQWLVKSNTLLQKLTAHFLVVSNDASKNTPEDARSIFIEIYDLNHVANVNLANTLEKLHRNKGRRNAEIDGMRMSSLEKLNQIRDVKMEGLMKVIAAEIRADASLPEPEGLKSFWRYFFSW